MVVKEEEEGGISTVKLGPEKFDSYERTQFNPENIEMQTDITHEEVWDHALALHLNDITVKYFGIDLGIYELIYKKELRGPSEARQSRTEATEVYKEAGIEAEALKKSPLDALFGRKTQ